MVDVINTLKSNARILHRLAISGDHEARARVTRRLGQAILPDGEFALKRRHCLTVVARELGFNGWGHAAAVLEGNKSDDFGTLLSPPRCSAHANIWCRSYDEAKSVHAVQGGYLLAYKNQYLVVDEDYIRTLGLDPDDENWVAMGKDWARPKDITARGRLYATLACQVIPVMEVRHDESA